MKTNKKFLVTLFLLFTLIAVEARKTRNRGSGSGRGSSRKTSNPQPAPTSFSYPQPTAAKPSLSGWQERPAQKTQTSSRQSKPSGSQGHSYPSSNTGLSGSSQPKQPPTHQESIQRSNSYNSHSQQGSRTVPQSQNNNQAGHSYPVSTGLSGGSGSGAGYPQQGSGLSGSGVGYPSSKGSGQPGSGAAYPAQQGNGLSGPGVAYPSQHGSGLSGAGAASPPYSGPNRAYSGGNYQQQHPQNYHGNSYNNPQGPPPPYHGSNYGGFGGHGGYNPGYGSQMPGYFGNYGGGFGGVRNSGSSTLSKVGLAGAGIGTVLTGLALWNLARSTGHHQHTVIYDNRGQPVAVAPANNTENAVDPFLADLVNCSLTITNDNATEIIAIPCAIATSFRPDTDVKTSDTAMDSNDKTKCIVSLLTKSNKEYTTTIPCSILLKTAAENNVTEPPLINSNETDSINGNMTQQADSLITNQPSAEMLSGGNHPANCTPQPPEVQDPINPCLPVTHNLTVIPITSTENGTVALTTPVAA